MQKLRLESQPEFLFCLISRPLFEEFEAFQINISTNKIDDYEVSYGFYSNGNNECNRNELGRQLILST